MAKYKPNRSGVRELATSAEFVKVVQEHTERVAARARASNSDAKIRTTYGIGGTKRDRATGYVVNDADAWVQQEFGGGPGVLRGALRS